MVVALPQPLNSLFPPAARSAWDAYVGALLVYPLMEPAFGCELTFEPALARTWSYSEDGLSLQVTLRPDISWGDGEAVTARDVAFAFHVAREMGGSTHQVQYLRHLWDDTPKVLDQHRLEFRFKERLPPDIAIAQVAAIPPLPAHLLEDLDPGAVGRHTFNREPVLNGPWRVESWQPGVLLSLVPNPTWSGPEEPPPLERLVFRVIPEYVTRLAELETGGVHMAGGIMPVDVDRLAREAPHLETHRRGWRSLDFIAWNQTAPAVVASAGARPPSARHPLFADPSTRLALGLALDVGVIMETLIAQRAGEPLARRATGPITPALCDLHHDGLEPLPHDLERARKLLADQGWVPRPGDGLLEREGEPFSFSLMLDSSAASRQQAATMIQAQLQALGAQVRLEQVDPQTFQRRLRLRDFDAALGGRAAGLMADPGAMWHSQTNHRNLVGYSDPEIDRILDSLDEATAEERRALLHRFQEVIHRDQPYTFLYWTDEATMVDGRFNVEVDILSPLRHAHRWRPAERP